LLFCLHRLCNREKLPDRCRPIACVALSMIALEAHNTAPPPGHSVPFAELFGSFCPVLWFALNNTD